MKKNINLKLIFFLNLQKYDWNAMLNGAIMIDNNQVFCSIVKYKIKEI